MPAPVDFMDKAIEYLNDFRILLETHREVDETHLAKIQDKQNTNTNPDIQLKVMVDNLVEGISSILFSEYTRHWDEQIRRLIYFLRNMIDALRMKDRLKLHLLDKENVHINYMERFPVLTSTIEDTITSLNNLFFYSHGSDSDDSEDSEGDQPPPLEERQPPIGIELRRNSQNGIRIILRPEQDAFLSDDPDR